MERLSEVKIWWWSPQPFKALAMRASTSWDTSPSAVNLESRYGKWNTFSRANCSQNTWGQSFCCCLSLLICTSTTLSAFLPAKVWVREALTCIFFLWMFTPRVEAHGRSQTSQRRDFIFFDHLWWDVAAWFRGILLRSVTCPTDKVWSSCDHTCSVADRLGGVGLGPIKTFGGFSKFWKYVVLWRSPGAAGTENKAPR